jgi:hypothetical protein
MRLREIVALARSQSNLGKVRVRRKKDSRVIWVTPENFKKHPDLYEKLTEGQVDDDKLVFMSPSAYTMQFLDLTKSRFDTEVGGYTVETRGDPQKLKGGAIKFEVASGTPKMVTVRQVGNDLQVQSWED